MTCPCPNPKEDYVNFFLPITETRLGKQVRHSSNSPFKVNPSPLGGEEDRDKEVCAQKLTTPD